MKNACENRRPRVGPCAEEPKGAGTPNWAEPVPEPAPKREAVPWPGSAAATLDTLNALATQWSDVLSCEADLARPVAYPWNDPRPLRLLLAWANCELMKNVAEVGILRHLFAASDRSG